MPLYLYNIHFVTKSIQTRKHKTVIWRRTFSSTSRKTHMTVSTCHSAAKKGFVKQDRRNSDPKACNAEKVIGQKNSSKRLVKLFVKNSLYKIRQKIVKKKVKKIVKKIIKKS